MRVIQLWILLVVQHQDGHIYFEILYHLLKEENQEVSSNHLFYNPKRSKDHLEGKVVVVMNVDN